MIVVIVIFLVVYILDFFSPLVSLSEFVVWCETSTEASSDNEQAKRNDRLLGTAIKARASFGARLLPPEGFFSSTNNATSQTSQLSSAGRSLATARR